MASSESRVVRFGVFEGDLGARELRKRGVRIHPRDQPFQVIEALLEKRGQIVTRKQPKERLWADDEFIEFDKNRNAAIQKIRQALSDSAESPGSPERVLASAPPAIRWQAVLPWAMASLVLLASDERYIGGDYCVDEETIFFGPGTGGGTQIRAAPARVCLSVWMPLAGWS